MRISFLFVSSIFCVAGYSQKTFIYSAQPNWDYNSKEVIRSQNLKNDSVYLYKKRQNNKDSTLIMTEYFDSLGNLLERDEYGFNGKVFRINNYTYMDTILLKSETMSNDMVLVDRSRIKISRKIKTFQRDSSGNIIAEKEYSFFGDSLKFTSVTEWNRDYDGEGHLVKEFITLPKSKKYLRHVYAYTNGKLTEIKTYDSAQSWTYSYRYEYDEKSNTTNVYLINYEKKLSHEFFYIEKNVVAENDYEQGDAGQDHATQTYSYDTNGLLESQTFQDIRGKNYYYKHYYSK